ncbi:hypothetical protein ACKWTF_001387 [Chironomus riparius]
MALCFEKFLSDKATKRRTRNSISRHNIIIKDIKDEEIICEFNEQSEVIVKVIVKEVQTASCSSCEKFCEHQEITVRFLASHTSLKRKIDDDDNSSNEVDNVKRIKLSENEENSPDVANTVKYPEIKISKKKKKSNLTEKQLEEINKVGDKLRIDNLIKSFGKKGSYNEFYKHCGKIMSENMDLIKLANKLTIEQADTDLWHQLRVGRVTASRLYETTKCNVKNGSLVDKFLGKSSGWSFMMMRGTVLEEYVFKEVQKEYPTLKQCGLIMCHKVHPLFAASPDGIHEDFVLEIKCPGTANTFQQYTNLDKLNKKYFAQIQLQMFVTGKRKALLAVASLDFETTRKITKLWIEYDEEYTTQMITDASEFYEQAVYPALKRKFLH